MAVYSLDSWITPIGLCRHQVTVRAVAADKRCEDVRTDIVMSPGAAESRRMDLVNAVVTHLRAGGHEVVDAIR